MGTHQIKDVSNNGGLTTIARITVDIDYPEERRWWGKDGIDYRAFAKATASFQWGTQGVYRIDCFANEDVEVDHNTYALWTRKSEHAKHFVKKRDDEADALNDFDEDDVRAHLAKCSAMASITRRQNYRSLDRGQVAEAYYDDYYGYESSASAK